ncbi:Hypothetical predicted protein [Paramuricea clavata]|uniref:Uncharacterized protein n=1 Tax=Paramuricea clavata TaxID=317549 RepID=A0A7D9LIL3_PARCT|nr:Hypothetical predicted protein [Paramuricea clavata]
MYADGPHLTYASNDIDDIDHHFNEDLAKVRGNTTTPFAVTPPTITTPEGNTKTPSPTTSLNPTVRTPGGNTTTLSPVPLSTLTGK